MKQTYRCWAEIDQSALRHNGRLVRERVGSAEIIAVVKANAYGHGLIDVAETLADSGATFWCRESGRGIGTPGILLPSDRHSWTSSAGRKIDDRRARFHSHNFCSRGSRRFQSSGAPLASSRQFQDRYGDGPDGNSGSTKHWTFSRRSPHFRISRFTAFRRICQCLVRMRPTRAISFCGLAKS